MMDLEKMDKDEKQRILTEKIKILEEMKAKKRERFLDEKRKRKKMETMAKADRIKRKLNAKAKTPTNNLGNNQNGEKLGMKNADNTDGRQTPNEKNKQKKAVFNGRDGINGSEKSGKTAHRTPRDILDERFHEAIQRAHAKHNIPHPNSSCQEKSKIYRFLRSLHKPMPMPEKLRNERMKLGLPVPDETTSYVEITNENKDKMPNTQQKEW